jgi:hypothetical protein
MIFFRLVVHVTTYWENHRTDTEYEDSLVSVVSVVVQRSLLIRLCADLEVVCISLH